MAACGLVVGCFCCVSEQVWQAEWAWCKTKLRDGDTINRSWLTHTSPFNLRCPETSLNSTGLGRFIYVPLSTPPSPHSNYIFTSSHFPWPGKKGWLHFPWQTARVWVECVFVCMRPSIHPSSIVRISLLCLYHSIYYYLQKVMCC